MWTDVVEVRRQSTVTGRSMHTPFPSSCTLPMTRSLPGSKVVHDVIRCSYFRPVSLSDHFISAVDNSFQYVRSVGSERFQSVSMCVSVCTEPLYDVASVAST